MTFLKESKNLQLCEVTTEYFQKSILLEFLQWLVDFIKNSIATRNQRLIQIRGFCRYIMNENMLSLEIYSKLQEISKKPDPRKDELEFLSIEEMKLVLEQPDITKRTGIRDRFFITLLYDSGCRDQEILDLTLKDLKITGKTGELHIIGKGNKFRVTPLSEEVTVLFKQYKALFLPEGKPDDLLFYTIRNGILHQMSPDNVARFLKLYETKAKQVKKDILHLHPHLFRHSRAMHLYMAGMPLPLVAEWLGHSQIETTTIYARATTEMKREAAKKASTAEKSIFKLDETFKYEDDDEIIKKLYGLS